MTNAIQVTPPLPNIKAAKSIAVGGDLIENKPY